ncbi:MAG: S9 family peptidase [Alistipes sp.]|nr:S9 family peptidase [Alistipes sp.]
MKLSKLNIILAAALTLVGANAFSQKTYSELQQISSLNRGVSGLRSMQDGEHYTVSRGGAILRHSYTDKELCDTLYKGRFASYEFSPTEEMLILGNNYRPIYRHSSTVDYQIVSLADGKTITELKDVRDLTLSPDSKWVAYSKQNNLYIAAMGHEATAITNDGEWNKIINGTADWVYEEEYGFTQAYAFSPDSKQIAYLRFDESQVPTFEMMRFDGKLYNEPYSFKYPKAGDKNSVVELWLYDIASGKKQMVASGEELDLYIPFIGWTPAGELYYYSIDRKQRNFEVILYKADGSHQTIYKESSPRYVERPSLSTIRFIDGDRFIAQNETISGWNHLYLYSIKSGIEPLRALTEGEWQVTSIVETTDKNIYYISTESSPLRRNLYSIDYKGKNKRRLTELEGTYSISPSKGMKYYISTFSSASAPRSVEIRNAKGELVRTLVENNELKKKMESLPHKEFFTFTTERGDKLNAYIIKPADFDSNKKYPVLLTQYSGPGSQSVADSFSLGWENVMVGNGYIVVCCDGRGTGYMGEEFKKQTYGDLGRLEVEDQISFARYMASQPYVDSSRIGIYGWSYGGFMALGCALKGDGLFKMAIAVAPVTSWRYYDTIYTEIYNDLPQDNPKGYDENSPINFADKLHDRTRLLIMHGTADDNVHVQNTMEMCHALNRAGKQYDMMIYPDQNHSMYPAYANNIRIKMIQYTLENL